MKEHLHIVVKIFELICFLLPVFSRYCGYFHGYSFCYLL